MDENAKEEKEKEEVKVYIRDNKNEEVYIKEEILQESAVEDQSLVYVREGDLKVELTEIKGEILN